MAGFTEVADRVWVARHEWFDVNVCLVAGSRGLVVVDTGASAALGRAVLTDCRRVSGAPLLLAVNTHVHFDHVLGNGVLAAAGADLLCHESAAAAMPAHIAETREATLAELETEGADGRLRDLVATEPVVPPRTFSSAYVVDLGDRALEVVHPGRGHTDGDLVVRIPDVDVVLAGDLVEEGRDAVPGFGPDCYPLEWPLTLDVVLGLTTAASVVVPGHGAPVDRRFVEDQCQSIAVVGQTIHDLAGRGVGVEDALAAGEWPFPASALGDAVRRGYAQLPRGGRRLPLL